MRLEWLCIQFSKHKDRPSRSVFVIDEAQNSGLDKGSVVVSVRIGGSVKTCSFADAILENREPHSIKKGMALCHPFLDEARTPVLTREDSSHPWMGTLSKPIVLLTQN